VFDPARRPLTCCAAPWINAEEKMTSQIIGLEVRQYATRRVGTTSTRADARSFLLRSTQKVVDHYRRLLSTHSLSETEKDALLLRLEKHERLLRDLESVHPETRTVVAAHREAA
jgi:hypothetical protein